MAQTLALVYGQRGQVTGYQHSRLLLISCKYCASFWPENTDFLQRFRVDLIYLQIRNETQYDDGVVTSLIVTGFHKALCFWQNYCEELSVLLSRERIDIECKAWESLSKWLYCVYDDDDDDWYVEGDEVDTALPRRNILFCFMVVPSKNRI